jgi:hypothetical protein
LEQAKAVDGRLAKEIGQDTEKRIRRVYQLLYARLPDAGEVKLGVEYLNDSGNTWPEYLQVLLGAAEFASVD